MQNKPTVFRPASATQTSTSKFIALVRVTIGVDAPETCRLSSSCRLVALTIANMLNDKTGTWSVGYAGIARRCGLHVSSVKRATRVLCHGPDALFSRRFVPTVDGNKTYEYAWLHDPHAFRNTDSQRQADALRLARVFVGIERGVVPAELEDLAIDTRRRYQRLRMSVVSGERPTRSGVRELSKLVRGSLRSAGYPLVSLRDVFDVRRVADVFRVDYQNPVPEPSPRASRVQERARQELASRGIDVDQLHDDDGPDVA